MIGGPLTHPGVPPVTGMSPVDSRPGPGKSATLPDIPPPGLGAPLDRAGREMAVNSTMARLIAISAGRRPARDADRFLLTHSGVHIPERPDGPVGEGTLCARS